MKARPRIAAVEPVIHGVVKLIFVDGYEGVADLRPVIERGRIWTHLQDPGISAPSSCRNMDIPFSGWTAKATRSILAPTGSAAIASGKPKSTADGGLRCSLTLSGPWRAACGGA